MLPSSCRYAPLGENASKEKGDFEMPLERGQIRYRRATFVNQRRRKTTKAIVNRIDL